MLMADGETFVTVGEWRCSCGAQHVWAHGESGSLMSQCPYCGESAEILPVAQNLPDGPLQ